MMKDDFKEILIPHFIDGDSEQLDPCFAAFKRIYQIKSYSKDIDNLIANMQLSGKASIIIDSLEINECVFNKLQEFYKDKEVNIILEELKIDYDDYYYISSKDAEFINKISPKNFIIHGEKCTIQNIKALFLLNCMNIDADFSYQIVKNLYLCFKNTPIQLFDSDTYQIQTYECESIKFFIENNETAYIKILKTFTGIFLFIPLSKIDRISFSGFKEILGRDDINSQFAELDLKHRLNGDGFIIPKCNLIRILTELDNSQSSSLTKMKKIIQKFKGKQIELKIANLDRLLKIN